MATNSTFIKVSSGVKLVGKINFQVIWRKRGFLITVALCKDDAKEMIYIYKRLRWHFLCNFFII